MIPKVILLTQRLFENVDQQQQQSQTPPCNYQHDIDVSSTNSCLVTCRSNKIGNRKCRSKNHQKLLLQNYGSIQLQYLQVTVYQQCIVGSQGSNGHLFLNSIKSKKKVSSLDLSRKQTVTISYHFSNIKRIKQLIQKQLNDLSELSDVKDVENYAENEFEKIYIFRLSQILQNEIENLQYQFQQSQIKNNDHFNQLNEKFLGIINDQTFIKISCQIHNYIILLNLIDDYRDNLFDIIKSKSLSTESIIYQQSKQKAKSLQYDSMTSLDLIDDQNKINKRQHPLFKQEVIKNNRFDNQPEACVKCQIF